MANQNKNRKRPWKIVENTCQGKIYIANVDKSLDITFHTKYFLAVLCPLYLTRYRI